MPQTINFSFPQSSEDLRMESCITFFKDFYVHTTVSNDIVKPVNVSESMIADFNALTASQKTVVKTWEKMKIAKLYNAALTKWLGAGNFTPLVYSDIPDSFFE